MKRETIKLSNGVTFDIWIDAGRLLQGALDNWLARRTPKQLTAQNFCNYVKSKGFKAQTTAP